MRIPPAICPAKLQKAVMALGPAAAVAMQRPMPAAGVISAVSIVQRPHAMAAAGAAIAAHPADNTQKK